MRLFHYFGCVGLFVALFSFSAGGLAQGGLSEYTLGSGDVIRIQVYGESDLTMETQLSDTGTLSYPFLGELHLRGMTVGQLQKTIIKGLAGDYLLDPKVSVTILQYRQFYISGEVERPGGFPFQPGLTIRKAVSLAEGFTERASKSNIFVISDNDDSHTPRQVQLNSPVKPGDSITVEQSFF
ncbi:polysaccharide biosynthesis/export family protein [Pseudomaricurvus sp.]|uniref:polysaccharide biosynthesis/export family protein n=1 Tax=Pseudomaricurvus sp. TaxID=2004510 RepID=UPI003F6C5150